MPLPKVLIVNQPFNTNTGGGITLSNLFANWDRDKLAVACSGYLLTEDMDPTPCNTYYQLGFEERKWIFPLNLFSRTYYSGDIKPTGKNTDKVVTNKSRFRDKIIMNYAVPFLEYIGFDHFKAKIGLSPRFCDWLDRFEPAVVYAQAYNREDVLFCLELKKYLKATPFVFHMMDDWPSTVGTKGIMNKYWEKKVNREFQVLMDHTDMALSISDYMAEEYKKRYGKDFTTFHNPINLDFWKSAQKNDYGLQGKPVILYAGRLGLGIDSSIKTIAKAIEQINSEEGMQIEFVLQTPETPNWIRNYECITHRGFAAYKELPKYFSGADLLVLPYDFNAKALSFIKYSMPTKASEYMACGTPIVVFAPSDTALVKYAKKYGWAKVITENRSDTLFEVLTQLLKNESLREEIAQKAKHISEQRHDSDRVARDFQNIISSMAE